MRKFKLKMVALLGLWTLVGIACTPPAGHDPITSPTPAGRGLEAPEHPYGPFPYDNDVQKEAFHAFLECAAGYGVRLRGPYADSRGQGAMLKPAKGAKVSASDRLRVSKHCPQAMVALAATPNPGHRKERLMEKAMVRFSRCLRAHGYPGFPIPHFGSKDPYEDLSQMPFEWSSARFVRTAARCIEPVRGYVLGG